MRPWMAEPVRMCDKHLLGEHAERHMLAGTVAKRRSIDGCIAKGLLESASLGARRDAPAARGGRARVGRGPGGALRAVPGAAVGVGADAPRDHMRSRTASRTARDTEIACSDSDVDVEPRRS